jgi:hypothetical protein
VYKLGVEFQKCDEKWRPENSNQAEVKALLKIKDGAEWKPTADHMCRMFYYKLSGVSREPGTCCNDGADEMKKDTTPKPDLRFKREKDGGPPGWEQYRGSTYEYCTLELGQPEQQRLLAELPARQAAKTAAGDPAETMAADSWLNWYTPHSKKLKTYIKPDNSEPFIPEKYYWECQSKEALHDGTVPVFCEDWGAFGLLKLDVPGTVFTDDPAGTVDENALKEPRARNGRSIPLDDDHNHIADGLKEYAGLKELDDTDANPVSNFPGDGLTAYEEYRGFMVQDGGKTKHVSTQPGKKDLFVNNQDKFDLTLFVSATGLEVHTIIPTQYNGDQGNGCHEINFTSQLFKGGPQHGLWLVDGPFTLPPNKDEEPKSVLGIALENGVGNRSPVARTKIKVDRKKIAERLTKIGKPVPKKEQSVVAHELCHGVGCWHHGEAVGKVDPAGAWAIPHGRTSGDVDCVMRYENYAQYYMPAGKTTVIKIPVWPEPVGTTLCDGAKATGYPDPNDGNKVFLNPAGDCDSAATTGPAARGNCKSQLRVKDW